MGIEINFKTYIDLYYRLIWLNKLKVPQLEEIMTFKKEINNTGTSKWEINNSKWTN